MTETVLLTYHLETACSPHKPFCPQCENTFKIDTCWSKCSAGPTIICPTPIKSTPIGCCNSIFWELTISGLWTDPAWPLTSPTWCSAANGTYVLQSINANDLAFYVVTNINNPCWVYAFQGNAIGIIAPESDGSFDYGQLGVVPYLWLLECLGTDPDPFSPTFGNNIMQLSLIGLVPSEAVVNKAIPSVEYAAWGQPYPSTGTFTCEEAATGIHLLQTVGGGRCGVINPGAMTLRTI